MGKSFAEYSLAELVEDPLVGLVMKSDGVDRRCLELLFERVARELTRDADGERSCPRGAESKRCTSC
jgi:hypothetical protein